MATPQTPTPLPPCVLLRTQGSNIVTPTGQPIILKGAALGGMLNMENFITGYSGHEHEHRSQLSSVLGPEKATFFFNRLLHHFFTEADASFFASLGLNCIRVPFNYRHFIDDLEPDVIKEEGFTWLDRVINICGAQNIYVILDLHAVPGGQNQDWHCDSGSSRAAFWEFKDHQDRALKIWSVIAGRYQGNPVVAGYNPLNEPADSSLTEKGNHGARLLEWYKRAEKVIRGVDAEHILFLDGNTYSMDFGAFEEDPIPLPNAVYSIHDYSLFGFPGQERYTGTEEQKEKLKRSFERKVKFMRQVGVPVWNGEFGPVYQDPRRDGVESASRENGCRIALLEEQLKLYRAEGVSWSIWLYKDIGYQGMTYVDPDSAYMKFIRPFLEKKQKLGLDFWTITGRDAVAPVYEQFFAAIKGMVDERFHKVKYPKIWTFERQFERVIREMLLSEYVGWELAEMFRGKTEEELEELAGSFALGKCVPREELNEVLRRDAAL
ncbi:putative cellulase [Aspergillus karnatakaensis]|uniref:glycoside hydrolase family 5 protein n=1 Tax=Aspergillus karnatakaensis TaxID=1810916 RepID=UPI003CCE2FAD